MLLSLAAFAGAHRMLPNFGGAGSGRIDLLGAGLLICALLSIMHALSWAASAGAGSWQAGAAALAAIGLAAGSVVHTPRLRRSRSLTCGFSGTCRSACSTR